MDFLEDIDLSDNRTLYILIGVSVGAFLITIALILSCCIVCRRRRERKSISRKMVLPTHSNKTNTKVTERTESSGTDMTGHLTTEIIVENHEDDVSTLGDDFDLKDYPGAASILGMALARNGDSSASVEESIKDLIAASTVDGSTSNGDAKYIAKAPPGKLGMIVDTAEMDRCPYVHTIKADSVLIDQVRPGDRLLTVNGHDVTCMTALEVSRLIAKLDPDESRTFELERYLQWSEKENWYRNSV